MTDGESGGPRSPEQVPTGVPGLDQLLAGGLHRGGLHVMIGGPGAGKSVLAHHIGANLIRAGGSVLYLTALVESHETLISQARSFRFFDPASVPGSFYYASLYPALAAGGLDAVGAEIRRLVIERAPSLVIIDGVHALKVATDDRLAYQRFIHELEAHAAVARMTMLLLAHPPGGMIAADPTFTIADAVLHVRSRMVRLREVRIFSVGKLRGVAHVGGWHTFRITGDGAQIFPRVESVGSGIRTHVSDPVPAHASEDELLASGVEGLDEMLGGGLARNSATLVVGTPGSGKTLLGLAFLSAGAEAGEPGLLLGYHEPPRVLIGKGEAAGLPIGRGLAEGKLHFHWKVPAELLADEEIGRLLEMVEEYGIKRVVIDALEDLREAVIPRRREVNVLASFTSLLRERGVTSVLMHDIQRLVGVSFDMPMAELSGLMDNVLHLRYVEQKGEMKRLVAILKVRARAHDHALKELHILEKKGLHVGKAYDNSEMVLTGLGLPR